MTYILTRVWVMTIACWGLKFKVIGQAHSSKSMKTWVLHEYILPPDYQLMVVFHCNIISGGEACGWRGSLQVPWEAAGDEWEYVWPESSMCGRGNAVGLT